MALVLAIDGSASVDALEFDLQKRGYHGALTDPRIADVFAIAGVVDIAAVFWADSAFKPQIIPFHRIRSSADAGRFADTLLALDRRVSGDTDLAKGLSVSLDLFESPGHCANRLMIDVSSDGRASLSNRTTSRGSLARVRERADTMGVVVNALVIDGEDRGLADYYLANVTVGPRSFVMDVTGFDSFRTAIGTKLMRELLSDLENGMTCVYRATLSGAAAQRCGSGPA